MQNIIPKGTKTASQVLHVPIRVRFDPSHHNVAEWQPAPIRETAEIVVVQSGGGWAGYGHIDSASASLTTAAFTVVSIALTRDHVICIGDYRIMPGIHYTIGVDVGTTATAIAAAINALPWFSASAVGAIVTVTYHGNPSDLVRFEVLQGAVPGFSTISPAGGWMTTGEPDVGPIILG